MPLGQMPIRAHAAVIHNWFPPKCMYASVYTGDCVELLWWLSEYGQVHVWRVRVSVYVCMCEGVYVCVCMCERVSVYVYMCDKSVSTSVCIL